MQILPDYAEAYNRRAVLAFDANDRAAAISDIEDALKREPRHFGALAGLGMIYESIGQKRAAYEAYKAALAIDPFLDRAKQGVRGSRRTLKAATPKPSTFAWPTFAVSVGRGPIGRARLSR